MLIYVDGESQGDLQKCCTGVASATVPAGKIGIKASPKVGTKVLPQVAAKGTGKLSGKAMGMVVTKIHVEGASKAVAKLTSKIVNEAVAKVFAKVAAKIETVWIPTIGGVVSGGINWWLIGYMMDSAEQHYSNEYVVFDSEDLNIHTVAA